MRIAVWARPSGRLEFWFSQALTPSFDSGAQIVIPFQGGDCRSARRPNRHYADHIDQKPRVLTRRYRFEQGADDSDVRILADALRKFRDPRELHVVRRQAQMALSRGVDVLLFVRHQERHVIDAVRAGKIAKMHVSLEGDSD